MNLANVLRGVQSESDAALVRDDDNAQARAIHAVDGLGNAGQHLKLAPPGDVATLRHLAIENSIAIQKDGAQLAGWNVDCGIGHNVMIATVFA